MRALILGLVTSGVRCRCNSATGWLWNLHQDNSYQHYDYGHDFNQDAAYNRVAQLTGTYFFKL